MYEVWRCAAAAPTLAALQRERISTGSATGMGGPFERYRSDLPVLASPAHRLLDAATMCAMLCGANSGAASLRVYKLVAVASSGRRPPRAPN